MFSALGSASSFELEPHQKEIKESREHRGQTQADRDLPQRAYISVISQIGSLTLASGAGSCPRNGGRELLRAVCQLPHLHLLDALLYVFHTDPEEPERHQNKSH